jgi:hypothetical protein
MNLTAIGLTQADNSAGIDSIYESDKKESVSNRSQSNNPDLSVVGSIIDPCKSNIPIELSSRSQRDSVLAEIGSVFARVEIDELVLK